MALNTKWMIAPSLQEYFVDKDTGLPLANGKVFFYADDDRSQLKPIYTLSGTPPNYSYTVLSNPVELNAVGTFSSNGTDDVLPYYYPYNETNVNTIQLYYIEVYSEGGVLQFTRQGYPNLGTSSSDQPFGYNFVRNPQFYSWHNTTSFTGAGLTSLSDNDFTADDWSYQNDDAAANITIARQPFGTSTLTGNPAYYLNYSSGGGSGQTVNNIYQKFESVLTLAGQNVSAGIFVRSTSSVPVSIVAVQYFGSGGSPSASTETTLVDIPATTTGWAFYSGTALLPDTTTKILGTNGDDALYLRIKMPLNTNCNIGLTNIVMQIGTSLDSFPIKSNDDNNKATNYDNPNSIFRTGDVKTTIRSSSDPGWLLMDDGTIGNNGSGVAANNHRGLQYKSLYSLIWANIPSTVFAPIYTNAGVVTTRGSTAEEDWNANKRLSLTKVLGRVLAGAAPTGFSVAVPVTSYSSTALTVADGQSVIFNATPITFTGTIPTSSAPQVVAGTTYYMNLSSGNVYRTASDAVNGYNGGTAFITWTTGSTAPWYINTVSFSYVNGEFYGEENHNQIVPELASHSHGPASPGSQFLVVGGASITTGGAASGYTSVGSTALTGGNSSFNVFQPTTFMNVMIKV